MTDKEIIKALECCANDGDCKECAINPHKGNYGYCTSLAIKSALDLINRQQAEIETVKAHEEKEHQYCKNVCEPKYKAEIERLTARNFELAEKGEKVVIAFKNARAEAIKEFARKLKCGVPQETGIIRCAEIDNLVKEMVGDV